MAACTSGDTATDVPAADTATDAAAAYQVTLSEAQLKNAAIAAATIQSRAISSLLKVNGKIEVPPQNLVSVSVPMGGYIKSTKLLPGMHLNKGDIIAEIEDRQYIELQQDYLLTKSKLHFATLEYNRQRELNASQASSEKAVLQTEADVKNNQILLASLAEKLKLANINPVALTENNISKSIYIYSPINGFVSKVNVNIGKYINPADVLFELVNPADIHLNLKVFEKDIATLSIGKKLTAYTNANPDKIYPASIILISKDVAEDGTTEVHCHFDSYDKNLIPGMYINANIQTDSRQLPVLPEAAIVNFEGQNYIFVEKGTGTYQMQPVETGTTQDGFTEIKNAAAFGQQKIVEKGAYTLLMTLKNTEEE